MNAREDLARQLNQAARRRGRHRISGPAYALGAAVAAGAVAVALITTGAQPNDEREATAHPVPAERPAGPTNLGADHQTSTDALREHLERADPSYLHGTDWSAARSFAIPGTRLRGWTFMQPDKRCLALPDPLVEGYGITCNTPKQIANGQATLIITPPAASRAPNVVGVLLANGARASIETPPGKTARWENWSDLSVGTAPSGSRLIVADRRIAIETPGDSPIPSTDSTFGRWQGSDGDYTIIIEAAPNLISAQDVAEEAERKGLMVGILNSDEFTSMASGYQVVFTGVYSSPHDAQNELDTVRASFPDAYVRRVKA